MLTVEKLKQFGADTEEGLSRCMNMEEFYLNLCGMIKTEQNFAVLKEAIDKNDLDKAFEAAHSLKGVLGNLSITPLYSLSSEITELLRRKAEADYPALVEQLLVKKAEFDALFDE